MFHVITAYLPAKLVLERPQNVQPAILWAQLLSFIRTLVSINALLATSVSKVNAKSVIHHVLAVLEPLTHVLYAMEATNQNLL
jgi:hypothetical protein